MESTGFRWIPPESGYSVGFCWSPVIPLDSARVQWTSSAEKVRMDSVDSTGICWFPVDSTGLLPEYICQFGPCHTKTFRDLTPADSSGIRWNPGVSGGEGGGVYSPRIHNKIHPILLIKDNKSDSNACTYDSIRLQRCHRTGAAFFSKGMSALY